MPYTRVLKSILTVLVVGLVSPSGWASPFYFRMTCGDVLQPTDLIQLPDSPLPVSIASFVQLTTQPVNPLDPSLRLPIVEVDFRNFPTQRVVSVSDLGPLGPEGDGYYLLTRITDTWRSGSGPSFFAVDGDPTWIISALGARLAGFLGFRLLSATKMIVPNAWLFNRRILALNALLRKKGFEEIFIRWSPTIELPSDGKYGSYAEEYLRAYYFDRISPFSEDEMTHDTAFHSLEILSSASQVRPLMARIGIAIQFADFIRRVIPRNSGEFPILSHSENREALLALVFRLLSRNKDNFSGRIPGQLLRANATPSSTPSNSSHFRVAETQLGPEFGKRFAGNDIVVKFNKEYRLANWLEAALFDHLLPWVQQKEVEVTEDNQGYIESFEKLFQYTQIKYGQAIENLQKNPSGLEEEISRAFLTFVRNSITARTILAIYDKHFEVIGGIASPEHPVTSFQRRVKELNSALDP